MSDGGANPSAQAAEADIRIFLGLLVAPGNVFEVRVLHCKERAGATFTSTRSGYYQHAHIDKAVRDIAALDAQGLAPAIYVTLNPVAPPHIAGACCTPTHGCLSTTLSACLGLGGVWSAGPCSAGVCPGCYANCDGSTAPPVLNVLDFSCFLQEFAAADPYANCDNSTTPPVLNVLDFTCFLQTFAAGCP